MEEFQYDFTRLKGFVSMAGRKTLDIAQRQRVNPAGDSPEHLWHRSRLAYKSRVLPIYIDLARRSKSSRRYDICRADGAFVWDFITLISKNPKDGAHDNGLQ